jgi:hypothetical protein
MPVSTGSYLETLQDAATETGDGVEIDFDGFERLSVQISGTFSGTVTFEGSVDGTTYAAVGMQPLAGGAVATTATTAGIWVLPVAQSALATYRARVSAYSSGEITAVARKGYD